MLELYVHLTMLLIIVRKICFWLDGIRVFGYRYANTRILHTLYSWAGVYMSSMLKTCIRLGHTRMRDTPVFRTLRTMLPILMRCKLMIQPSKTVHNCNHPLPLNIDILNASQWPTTNADEWNGTTYGRIKKYLDCCCFNRHLRLVSITTASQNYPPGAAPPGREDWRIKNKICDECKPQMEWCLACTCDYTFTFHSIEGG